MSRLIKGHKAVVASREQHVKSNPPPIRHWMPGFARSFVFFAVVVVAAIVGALTLYARYLSGGAA